MRKTIDIILWLVILGGLSGFLINSSTLHAQQCSGFPSQRLVVPGKLDLHHLSSPGWTWAVKQRLEQIILAGANQGWPVFFDFDDTTLCRDIGEATLVRLVKDGWLKPEFIPESISPPFVLDGKPVVLGLNTGVVGYYEALHQSSRHHPSDETPYTTPYVWLVQMMRGLTPEQIVQATHKVFEHGRAEQDLRQWPGETTISLGPLESVYRVPFFYPEMVELIALFLIHGYDVWIVSASNPWSVRWLVSRYLNHLLLTRHGLQPGIQPHHVVGLATLLLGPDQQLYKDPLLVQENPAYGSMDLRELSRYRLTTQLIFPVPMYYGKVATAFQVTGRRPYFVAGNSANDLPLLRFGMHRLWMAQLDHAADQQKTAEIIQTSGEKDSWLIQPVLNKQSPGMVSTSAELSTRLQGQLSQVEPGLQALKAAGLLDGF